MQQEERDSDKLFVIGFKSRVQGGKTRLLDDNQLSDQTHQRETAPDHFSDNLTNGKEFVIIRRTMNRGVD